MWLVAGLCALGQSRRLCVQSSCIVRFYSGPEQNTAWETGNAVLATLLYMYEYNRSYRTFARSFSRNSTTNAINAPTRNSARNFVNHNLRIGLSRQPNHFCSISNRSSMKPLKVRLVLTNWPIDFVQRPQLFPLVPVCHPLGLHYIPIWCCNNWILPDQGLTTLLDWSVDLAGNWPLSSRAQLDLKMASLERSRLIPRRDRLPLVY